MFCYESERIYLHYMLVDVLQQYEFVHYTHCSFLHPQCDFRFHEQMFCLGFLAMRILIDPDFDSVKILLDASGHTQ